MAERVGYRNAAGGFCIDVVYVVHKCLRVVDAVCSKNDVDAGRWLILSLVDVI